MAALISAKELEWAILSAWRQRIISRLVVRVGLRSSVMARLRPLKECGRGIESSIIAQNFAWILKNPTKNLRLWERLPMKMCIKSRCFGASFLFGAMLCGTRLRENARLASQRRIANGKNMRQNCALGISRFQKAFLGFWQGI